MIEHRLKFSFILLILLGCTLFVACQALPNQLNDPASTAVTAANSDDQEADTTNAVSEEAEVSNLRTFQIIPAESEARFRIDEELRGEATTVVGVTSELSGEIFIDADKIALTQVGPIRIDARDLTTDSSKRNRAIQWLILETETEANQFITFTPSAIEGLPDTVTSKESFEFQIRGDLTISGVTSPEMFDMTVTANTEDKISGFGSATILYANYDLFIPEVPFVANVADEVHLEIEFVATAID